MNRKEFLRGTSHQTGVPNGPDFPKGKSLNMVRRHGNKHGNERWAAWARVGHQWCQFTFTNRGIHTAEIFDMILSKREFTTVAELKTVRARVLKLFNPVKEFKAFNGFVHVRKNGANKWRVYKVSGGKRLSCQCRNKGRAKRVQLEVAVAKSNPTTVHELRALVQKFLPGIAARKPFATMKANECNHFWAVKYTKKLVTHGSHYCGTIIPPDVLEGMLEIHKYMMHNKSYGHIIATVDGSGPRSKFLNVKDMLTQTFGRPPPPKDPEPFHIGMQTITDPARVKL